MHEISLVKNMFNSLEQEFPGRMQHLRGIYLTVGELSNVQPLLMQSAFAAVQADDQKYLQASLHVTFNTIVVHCSLCNKQSDVKNYKFICMHCLQPCSQVIQGEEMQITKVEFADLP